MNCLAAGALLLLLSTAALFAEAPSPGAMSFTLTETSGVAGMRLATVSFPFAPGEVRDLTFAVVTNDPDSITGAQARVLTRYRDGSVRRALIRFPWQPGAGTMEGFTLLPRQAAPLPGLVTHSQPHELEIKAGPRTVRADGMGLLILRGGQPECRVSYLGPGFPLRFLGPAITVVEDGPCFSWVSLAYAGGPWNVYLEVQADFTGRVRVISRLRMMQGGSAPTPQFGLEVGGLGAAPTTPATSPAKPATLPFSATTAEGGPRGFLFGPEAAATAVLLPDGAQIRQGRVSVKAQEGGACFELVRDAGLDPTVEDKDKLFYEGQERSVEAVLPAPPAAGEPIRLSLMTCRAEVPAQRRCAAVMGEPLVSWGKLQRLRQIVSDNAVKLICRDGDEFGDVTSGVSRTAPRWSITGLTRIDTGLDMLEDYYRGGDPRLLDLALGWAENWVCLKQYRGWDRNCFGGERYTMTAWTSIPSFGQKGIMMIAHAYEETGDPRYLESALAFADRAVQQMRTRQFFSSTSFSPFYAGGDANIRPGYLARDLVLMYRWTGKEEYLQAARTIMDGLATLAVGPSGRPTLRPGPAPGRGLGLLREGYPDPFSPFHRLVTGTDLGVTEDNSDHLKPFILDYVLEGAQYLYEETHDPVARDTMVSLSDFMLDSMEPGGIWNYAQRHAADGNSIGHMTLEIANTLLKSFSLTGDARYRDAAFSSFHLVCKAADTYGALIDGVPAPEDRSYFYPDDRSDLDFYRAPISLGNVGRDPSGYFLCAVDRILRLDPRAGEFLLSPPTNPRHKWIIEGVPVGGGPVVHEIGNCFIAQLEFGQDGDRESNGKSNLVLLEDGKPLGPAHCLHRDIRELGKGRFSHWTRQSLYFSTRDNTSPLTNGRRYEFYFGSPDRVPAARRLLPTTGGFADRAPHPSVALFARGVQAQKEGRWADALATWEEVLKRWPDSSPELWRQIGLWEKLGDRARVQATCRRFLAAFPRHDRAPAVRLKLAGMLLEDGNREEARRSLEAEARQDEGTPWGEEAAARLWHELGVGGPPTTVIHAVPAGPRPGGPGEPARLQVLRVADGLPSDLRPQVAASYDDAKLHLKLTLPLPAPWPSPESVETFRLVVDPAGEMTDYALYIVNSSGGALERPPMWHHRGEGIKAAEGWEWKVARGAQDWTAELAIPFSKLGFRPGPGRRTMRLGFRWDSLSGTLLWRPAIPENIRPHDCGWIVFD